MSHPRVPPWMYQNRGFLGVFTPQNGGPDPPWGDPPFLGVKRPFLALLGAKMALFWPPSWGGSKWPPGTPFLSNFTPFLGGKMAFLGPPGRGVCRVCHRGNTGFGHLEGRQAPPLLGGLRGSIFSEPEVFWTKVLNSPAQGSWEWLEEQKRRR